MRITVDLDQKTLKSLLEETGEKKKSPAVGKAVKEFLRSKRLKKFADLIRRRAFDYPLTNDQIEALETGAD